MSSQQQQQPACHRGIVKHVLSGDSVIIRGQPKGGPPPEKHLCLTNITARKLARRANPNVSGSVETKDDPYAWEAREFLRKKLVGKEVTFTIEYKVPGVAGREYGCIFLGKDTSGENISELLVSEGYVEVRRGGIKPTDDQQKLCELEDAAKTAGKGIWSKDDAKDHIRDIKWVIENPRNFVDSLHNEPVKAVVEHVRDGSTIRAFLLPNFQYVTMMMSGIRCPSFKQSDDGTAQQAEQFAEEAKFFTESRLLQRDVEIILESVSNANFVGSVLHPNGSIAELLVKEGFARCVDWSMTFVSSGVDKLRAAERYAKEKRLRIWKDYKASTPHLEGKVKEFAAKVMEIVNADALMVKTNEGSLKKIFLASIRPPRLPDGQQPESQKDAKGRQFRPLYDVPYMFEAREFLRQKLIGKKVNVVLDYVQPASNSFPEKTCCTVTIGGINVAEALVSKGLATVVRYRQDDDQRSSHYDELLGAESKAIKSGKGMHDKKDTRPIHRVADVSGDYAKAKQFLPFLQRAGRSEGVVEYVSSGSRIRIYMPKETCLITFLLAGISCPRASRQVPGIGALDAEPHGDDALTFTKELCMQREVEVEVENMDKAGNFIGWLWVEGANLSIALVEEGLSTVHSTAERSSHFRALQVAEETAKQKKEKIWSNYEEPKEQEIKDDVVERNISYVSVVVTEVRPTLNFYAQHADEGPQLIELMEQLRQEFSTNPPLPGSYTPKRGELCAAKFVDGEWYRARVEKIADSDVYMFYVDFGNREVTKPSNLASLPRTYQALRPAAHEYGLACAVLHSDVEYQQDAIHAFATETDNQTLLLNVEYKAGGTEYVTLLNADTKEDTVKGLIADGYLLTEPRKEKRLQKLVTEYKNAQEAAKKKRLNMWRYGDFTEDDAKEFGYQR